MVGCATPRACAAGYRAHEHPCLGGARDGKRSRVRRNFSWGGELTGTFAAIDVALPLAPGLAWDTSALYTTGEITAVPEA